MTISKEIKALNLQDATIELLKNSNLNEWQKKTELKTSTK
jgi:hypothetical protein